MELSNILKNTILEFTDSDSELTIKTETIDDVLMMTVIPTNISDVAKIIGKDGRTISALRVIMRAIYNSKNGNGPDNKPKKLRITVKDTCKKGGK